MKQYNNKTILSKQNGFTLMEIMVATVIFAMLAVSLLSLFNYVLKINRRGEALRQASQGSRDFVEFLVKEIRNGQIDYYVANGNYTTRINSNNSVPCGPPGTPGNPSDGTPTYGLKENKLGIINTENVRECFYYGDINGNYIGLGIFASSTGASTLVLQKEGIINPQILNPPNLRIDNMMFLIRPTKDPYTAAGGYAKVQPSAVIIIKFVVKLPTGEQVSMYYQTAVSENKYDIPN